VSEYVTSKCDNHEPIEKSQGLLWMSHVIIYPSGVHSTESHSGILFIEVLSNSKVKF